MMAILRNIRRRVALLASRAIVRAVRDTTLFQELQLELLAGETRDRAERIQDYGFTSVPHAGAEAVVLHIGANRDHPVVLAVGDRRYRLRGLEAGEVALYDDLGSRVALRRGGVVEVVAGTATATVRSGQIQADDGAGDSVLLSPAACRLANAAGASLELLAGGVASLVSPAGAVTVSPALLTAALQSGEAIVLTPGRCDIAAASGAYVNGQRVVTT